MKQTVIQIGLATIRNEHSRHPGRPALLPCHGFGCIRGRPRGAVEATGTHLLDRGARPKDR